MEAFSALLALCAGNSSVPVNSPHKGQWSGALMFSLICAWINDWVNNREAGDLRRHRGHYDVIVMEATAEVRTCMSCYIPHMIMDVITCPHDSDVIMGAMASQINGLSIAYLTVCSDTDQRKHQSCASLAFQRGIHRWPVNSPHTGPVTQEMFPFDDVIM